MRICLGSVIYKQAFSYLKDFLDSIFLQDSQDFDILLINDDIEDCCLKKIFKNYPQDFINKIKIIDIDEKELSVSLKRVKLISVAKNIDYDLLILLDCDDFMSKNRIRLIKEKYSDEWSFYYNCLKYFDGKDFFSYMPNNINNFLEISEYNYFGLSNTAINLKKINIEFIDSLKECCGNVFDWYLYSRILLLGGKGTMVNGCTTFYRIHNDNFIGDSKFNINEIEKEKNIKKQIYGYLMKYNSYYEKLLKSYLNNNIVINDKKYNNYWWSLTKMKGN